MVMIGAPVIVIMATVTITVRVAVVAIRIMAAVIGPVAIISVAIGTPMMSAVDASNATGC
jgi:hypothetical protein